MPPESPSNGPALTSVSVVGRGRLGTALAAALRDAGVTVHGPTGRGDTVAPADVVVLCVPDREIPAAAASAAGSGGLVGHTSGATGLDDVDFGIHPLQTFASGAPAAFAGTGCGIGGRTPEALEAARRLATLLGMRPFEIADEHRATYHAAATLASNFVVTLESAAGRLLRAAVPDADARTLLAPLARRTLENWVAAGSDALTGPIPRGDEVTVGRQRAAIAETAPDLLALFDVLTAQTRALTQTTGVGTERTAS